MNRFFQKGQLYLAIKFHHFLFINIGSYKMIYHKSDEEIISKIKNLLYTEFKADSSGHDWWHILRVYNLAKTIAAKEKANLFVVELAALLHDIADWKFNNGDASASGNKARMLLKTFEVNDEIINHVVNIIDLVTYKGAGVETTPHSIEGKIVQDADRLDALGAIGIARTFAYGGYKGRVMYDPEVKPVHHNTFDDYKKSKTPTINHFYEKLLLLKDRMNTNTGKQLANERHRFMELYLEQFYNEWNGNI